MNLDDIPGGSLCVLDTNVLLYAEQGVSLQAQRLVRRICAACRVPDTPNPADIEALGIEGAAGATLWRGRGCDECRSTGYRGRTGIYELFAITEAARSLILRRAPSRDIRREAIEAEMLTLRLDGWRKACDGVTTVEEILRVTQDET
jgi:type II secretory ATPase GspE/PulE/Tfp pilus assembly ATPase PilB-like protein